MVFCWYGSTIFNGSITPSVLSLGYPIRQSNQSLAFAESLPEPVQDSAELACLGRGGLKAGPQNSAHLSADVQILWNLEQFRSWITGVLAFLKKSQRIWKLVSGGVRSFYWVSWVNLEARCNKDQYHSFLFITLNSDFLVKVKPDFSKITNYGQDKLSRVQQKEIGTKKTKFILNLHKSQTRLNILPPF